MILGLKTVKYHCERCGYAGKLKVKDYILVFFTYLLIIAGTLFIFLLLFWYSTSDGEFIEYLVNKKISLDLTKFAMNHDNELRELALNYTINCTNGFSHCYARDLYKNLIKLPYRPSSKYKLLYDLNYTLANGGDCKQLSMLFASMMHSLGFDAEVVCSRSKVHCLNIVPLKNVWDYYYSEYALVDISMLNFIIIDKEENIWDYVEDI